ncbi:hypothetical protein COLO4_36647 [Corchorus olitorius]|uniref:Uncharacterized protein n=1 Tax=Corchorus olitorius TaxID=93759 RepID=A0A1R3G733_9ROSI|nr:hypothetical protein COLO4_36647 [Corchorus olitorius]
MERQDLDMSVSGLPLLILKAFQILKKVLHQREPNKPGAP